MENVLCSFAWLALSFPLFSCSHSIQSQSIRLRSSKNLTQFPVIIKYTPYSTSSSWLLSSSLSLAIPVPQWGQWTPSTSIPRIPFGQYLLLRLVSHERAVMQKDTYWKVIGNICSDASQPCHSPEKPKEVPKAPQKLLHTHTHSHWWMWVDL